MALKLITPASTYPVTLAEAKAHLHIDTTDSDSEINSFIYAATEYAEQITGRALITQTWELTLDAFPDAFYLTRVPVQSITSVKYYDTDGTEQTLSSTLYSLDNADDFGPAYVVPAYGTVWPPTLNQANAVRVRYVAGYANAAAVPESIKQWIKLQIGSQDFNRAGEILATSGKVEFKFADSLVDRFRVYA